jgi:hypothetical protein
MNRIEKLSESTSITELLDNLDPINTPRCAEDLLPEFCEYHDEGCELARACLDCPFPQCAYDRPWGQVRLNKDQRDLEIRRLYNQENQTMGALARQFHITVRTVKRILQKN